MNRPKRTARAALLAISLLVAACTANPASQICEWLGACDPPTPEPETLVVVCDRSSSSTCSKEALDTTVAVAIHHIKERLGSHLEVWFLGQDVAETEAVARFTIGSSTRSGRRATQAHQARQMEDAKNLVHEQAEPHFNSPPPSRSPLIEALGKISLTNSENTQKRQHIILITDGYQYGGNLDFECSFRGNPEELARLIQVTGILPEGSLPNTTVTFSHVTLGPIDNGRCLLEIGAVREIRKLWEEILTSAGARGVVFESGPPDLEALHTNNDFVPEGESEQ